MLFFGSAIQRITRRLEAAIAAEVKRCAREKVSVTHYGANHIHPKHLVYWIVVETDREKARLQADAELMGALRKLLAQHDYPIEGRDEVHIGFESRETVERESGGDFWRHWK